MNVGDPFQIVGCINPPPGEESSSSFSPSFWVMAKMPRASALTAVPIKPRGKPVAVASTNSPMAFDCLPLL